VKDWNWGVVEAGRYTIFGACCQLGLLLEANDAYSSIRQMHTPGTALHGVWLATGELVDGLKGYRRSWG